MIDPLSIIDKYYIKDSKLYRTLITHGEMTAKKSVQIAKRLNLSSTQIEFIYEAAMLHDIGIIYTNAPGIDCFGDKHYIEHGYLGANLLRGEKLIKHALVAERHTGTGLTIKQIENQKLPLPNYDMSPISIEEKIICYADKFFSKGKNLKVEKSFDQVVKQLAVHGEEGVEIFKKWHKIFN